jgi:hypothetical protein
LCYDIVLAGLPVAARTRWEAFMTTVAPRECHSELFRELAALHQEAGEVRGEVRSVLIVLEARGLAVPAAVRDQILACTDLDLLQTWLRRTVGAATAEDVVRG